jgi:long-chain acyl-CoA synthetase
MAQTLANLFFDTCRRHAGRPAMVYREGTRLRTRTWEQCQREVEALANWFIGAGFQAGDKVALLSETRPEWVLADMAMHAVGLVNVPVYPTLTNRQVAYIVRHSGARCLMVSNRRQLDKAMAIAADCPELEQVLLIEAIPVLEPTIPVVTWADALRTGRQREAELAPQRLIRMAAVATEDVCSIIYTSGTTGEPKGVMLSHGNVVANVDGILATCPLSAHDTSLSFLPLSHVLERITTYALMAAGATIGYAGSLDALAYDLAAIRPTVLTTVPRVLQKIHARIVEGIQHRTALERKFHDWGLAVGRQHWLEDGADAVGYPLADALVLKPIRDRFGGRLRLIVCGGAPMDRHVGEFFHCAGITVCEGYGLTETSPVVAMNAPGAIRFGTVGQLLPNVAVRIADDGEICVKGPNVMLGYYKDADATQAAIDADGWFHTGDVGELDADGYLRITDRKKELIVLSNGKKVAPQVLEAQLQGSPFIDQVMIVGEGQAFLTALIVPDFTQLNPWAYERGLSLDRQRLVDADRVRSLFRDEISRLTRDLASFERIKQFTLLPRDWTVDSGEQTATLKLRRSIILANHAEAIDAMYATEVV